MGTRWVGSWYIGLAAVAAAAVSVGAMQRASAQDDALMNQFRSGYASLACGLNCRYAWSAQRPQALGLYGTGQWQSLASLVMRTGYGNDLTWYYLGRAAEALGYLPAAQRYYSTSISFAGTSGSCTYETSAPPNIGQFLSQVLGGAAQQAPAASNGCDGFVFPVAAQTGLSNVMAELAPAPERRRVYHRTTRSTTSAARPRAAAPSPSSSGIVEAPSSSGAGAPAANSSGIVEAK